MNEKIKNKDAEAAKTSSSGEDLQTEELNEGLADTFPASDPVSVTRDPVDKKDEPGKR